MTIRATILLLALTVSACGQPYTAAEIAASKADNAVVPQQQIPYDFAVELAAEICNLYDSVYLNAQGFREFTEAFAEAASDEELLQADRCLHEQLLDWEE